MKKSSLTYQQSGVDYKSLDPIKIMAQQAAAKTALQLKMPIKEVIQSRGESAYVIDIGDSFLATITECLGTKALIADAQETLTGKTYYHHIAQDTIAMAVNDCITVGAKPLVINAYWATGHADWFANQPRSQALINGWQNACELSGASWGGGETPTLTGVINPSAIDLAASCTGIINPKSRLTLGDTLQAGDAIVVLESSGIHANGLTLARALASKLQKGYTTKIDTHTTFGEALLEPTHIYAAVIQAMFDQRIDIHYLANITGHGWNKLMRHPQELSYQIHTMPPVPPVLQFICQKAQISDQDAYTTFNMGAGFAIYVDPKDIASTITIAKSHNLRAYHVGEVSAGPRQVQINPKQLTLSSQEFSLRAHTK